MKRNLLTNLEKPRPADAKVGAGGNYRAKVLHFIFWFIFLLGFNLNGLGQQIIGEFPNQDGGYEGQSVGALGSTSSSTSWWLSSSITGSIISTGGRSGPKCANINMAGSSHRTLRGPAAANIAAGTNYTIQFFFKGDSNNDGTSDYGDIRGGVSGSSYQYAAYITNQNQSTWFKYAATTTSNPGASTSGFAVVSIVEIAGKIADFNIDDIVIYAGSVDISAPNSPGLVSISNATSSSLDVSWSAASGGVDGGGYVVVRYTTSPNVDNDPNQNGIYAVGNTHTNGTGSLVGTICYIGTGTSFTDAGLSSTTTYYYKVYTVDKAFNYSAESSGSGTTLGGSTPTITVNPTTLTGFNYVQGSGPSANQTFTCEGTNLTNDILLTAPTNYEISTNAGGPFGTDITLTQASGSVAVTTIYVRLMAGLPAGNYNSETVTATSTGATSKTVTLSGTVSGPIITITPTTLSGLDYDFGAGPSNFDDFAVSGTSLTANILLTAPSNYEIATVSGGPYSSTLTLTQSGGVVNSTTIYVRLKAGLAVGNYNQNSTATSTGAASKTVYLTGSVKSTPCLLEGFNNGTTAPAGWVFTSIGGTYTTSSNYGVASPSLKLDATNDAITTPVIGGATELSFWIKGQGTDASSALLVEGFNGSWVTIENIVPLPTSGTVKTYNSASTPALASGFTQLRFTYNRTAGNLSFDDVTVICSSVPNTINTGTVATTPFSVTCSTGATGTVAFTSTDLFSSNTYTAQLSNASGSFASPVNIGSLLTDANSGTITFTIPPGTPTGSGYMIRVISSNPVVIGSSSATFSVALSGGPCSCYEIESILVDACDEGVEGENEMFRFTVGGSNLNSGDIVIDWPNNPWLGVCQNATTDSIVAGINATVTPPGQVVQPVGGVIPAGATVMFFTSTAFDYSKFDFSALNYTLYAVFQCGGNTAGHFGNYTATGIKTLELDCGACASEIVSYNTDSLYAGDGATVDYDVPGNATYSDSGYCTSVPIFDVLPIELMFFKVTCSDNDIQLYWSTATEINNAFFTIEASDVSGDFRPIAIVQGAGNSNERIDYSFDVAAESKYFRLKQTDYDGKFTYSDVIAVDCEDSPVQLFPSLASEGENIKIIGEVSSIRVFDSMGREVFPEINENKVCCLEPGMYFFVINGKWNHKVVVQ